ncbi:MAG TPA: carboxypeptidase regulatory-like domain-containing protein, partial [Bacteroidales bacterium]|nr:carboxypeptidase regulatory-like domain-containing protein [Bacteroidales bacterium]
MKHSLLLTAAFLTIPFFASAQILKGKITDPSGRPVEYSTVYIRELRQGTTSNSNGDYEISLPK